MTFMQSKWTQDIKKLDNQHCNYKQRDEESQDERITQKTLAFSIEQQGMKMSNVT